MWILNYYCEKFLLLEIDKECIIFLRFVVMILVGSSGLIKMYLKRVLFLMVMIVFWIFLGNCY